MNLVEAEVDGETVSFGGYRAPLPEALRGSLQEGRVFLGARPEAFEDAAFADPSLPQIDVDVTVVEELGSDTHVIFPVDAPRVETEELRDAAAGQEAMLLAEDRAVFNARVDPRTDASSGRPLRLAVDPERFYFFDPATGENIQRGQRSVVADPRTPAQIVADALEGADLLLGIQIHRSLLCHASHDALAARFVICGQETRVSPPSGFG